MNAGAAVPLYQQVKDHIVERILRGKWPEGTRIPSENELVRTFGASRMTVNRALRELTTDGLLRRVQGVGTFVADGKAQSELLEIRNIADEIEARGHGHSAEPFLVRAESADADLAEELGVPPGCQVFHSILVHKENGVPVQFEDRYVNPVVAPDYLDLDFTSTTPNAYLMRAAPLSDVEHVVEATLPEPLARKLLRIAAREPCLLVRRKTWSGGHVASVVRLLHPGSRYRLRARFRHRGRPVARAAKKGR